MLGLNPWLILAVLLGLLGAFGGGYWRGYRAADQSAQVEALQARAASLEAALQEQRRQASAAKLIAEAASAREVALREQADDMAAEIEDYVRRLEQAPKTCDCGLSRFDVERLRGIAGPRASTDPPGPARAPGPAAREEPGPAGGR